MPSDSIQHAKEVAAAAKGWSAPAVKRYRDTFDPETVTALLEAVEAANVLRRTRDGVATTKFDKAAERVEALLSSKGGQT